MIKNNKAAGGDTIATEMLKLTPTLPLTSFMNYFAKSGNRKVKTI